MKCEQETLTNAYLDGELDAAASAQLETHLESCESCRKSIANQRAVRTGIRDRADYFLAPESVRSALTHQLGLNSPAGSRSASTDDHGAMRPRGEPSTFRRQRSPGWMQIGALAAALLVGWLLGSWPNRWGDRITDEVVSSHVRSLMGAGHLIDVASSDQHTVKPWFNGKLDFAPEVHDLSAQGFPLIGGRLDYIGGHPAAALVYRHKAHTINLFIWPAAGQVGAQRPASTSRGYNVTCWTAAGMENCAVSDMNLDDLKRFASTVRGLEPHAGT